MASACNRERGPIGIAGAGRIGQALGRLLHECGQPVVAVASRQRERAQVAAAFIGGGTLPLSWRELPRHATVILIAVPDDGVARVAAELADAGMSGGIALHTCGARGREVLAPLAAKGVSCGVLHPLQTVATPEQGVRAIPGAAFAVGGDTEALRWAESIVEALQGQALRLQPGKEPLYHAAAVMASNYLTALLDASILLMRRAGIERDQALRALAPLICASTENALTLGPLRAFTGPIERGDTRTVALHLDALSECQETIRDLYCASGLHAADMAARKAGGTPRWEIERLLRDGRDRNRTE